MNRQELIIFFKKNCSIQFVTDKNSKLTAAERRHIKTALILFDEWFDKYYELNISQKQKYASNKTISNPFSSNVSQSIDIKKLTDTVVDAYLNCIYNAILREINFQDKRRVRRKTYEDFLKGKYFSNKVGNRIVEAITTLNR